MTLFKVDDTLTVGQLNRRIGEALKRSFRSEIWIQGQIRNLTRSGRGHVYFDLIDPVPAGAAPKASIPVTLFDSNRQIVNRIITRTGNSVRIEDGVEVRVRGSVELYAPRGQVQLNMSSIDPEFTLGRLGADREQLLRELRAEGLIDANRHIAFPLVPLRVALITSDGSAAHADFTRQLDASGYAFDVTTVATRVQGEFAPGEIALAFQQADALDVDVIAVVRGGGARTDLAAFDTEPVARAIVQCSRPVVSGIGHEIDEAVADLVAHASFKTPTACAQHLVERVVAFDFELAARTRRIADRARVIPLLQRARVDDRATDVADRVHQRLERARVGNLESAASLERRVTRRIARSHQRLGELSTLVRIGAARSIDDADRRLRDAADAVGELPERHLARAAQRLALVEARVDAVDPVRTMRRGWSITTDADGRAVRSVHDLQRGDVITTRLADGLVASTVAELQPSRAPSSPPLDESADPETP